MVPVEPVVLVDGVEVEVEELVLGEVVVLPGGAVVVALVELLVE